MLFNSFFTVMVSFLYFIHCMMMIKFHSQNYEWCWWNDVLLSVSYSAFTVLHLNPRELSSPDDYICFSSRIMSSFLFSPSFLIEVSFSEVRLFLWCCYPVATVVFFLFLLYLEMHVFRIARKILIIEENHYIALTFVANKLDLIYFLAYQFCCCIEFMQTNICLAVYWWWE